VLRACGRRRSCAVGSRTRSCSYCPGRPIVGEEVVRSLSTISRPRPPRSRRPCRSVRGLELHHTMVASFIAAFASAAETSGSAGAAARLHGALCRKGDISRGADSRGLGAERMCGRDRDARPSSAQRYVSAACSERARRVRRPISSAAMQIWLVSRATSSSARRPRRSNRSPVVFAHARDLDRGPDARSGSDPWSRASFSLTLLRTICWGVRPWGSLWRLHRYVMLGRRGNPGTGRIGNTNALQYRNPRRGGVRRQRSSGLN